MPTFPLSLWGCASCSSRAARMTLPPTPAEGSCLSFPNGTVGGSSFGTMTFAGRERSFIRASSAELRPRAPRTAPARVSRLRHGRRTHAPGHRAGLDGERPCIRRDLSGRIGRVLSDSLPGVPERRPRRVRRNRLRPGDRSLDQRDIRRPPGQRVRHRILDGRLLHQLPGLRAELAGPRDRTGRGRRPGRLQRLLLQPETRRC